MMKMLPGLVIGIDLKFAEVIRPLGAEIAQCSWVIVHQSGGPFDSLRVGNDEGLLHRQRLDVAGCYNTDCSCWRPHTFPRLAEHVRLDEYTHFFALRCSEEELGEWAQRYARRFTGACGNLDGQADLVLLYGDGWWDMNTPHIEWRLKYRRAFPGSYERSWRKAGELPTELSK